MIFMMRYQTYPRPALSPDDAGQDRAISSLDEKPDPAGQLLPARTARTEHRGVRQVLQCRCEDLRKVTLDPELQKKLAPLGSYTNPMSPAEATAFVHKQQQTWQPILDEIAKNQR